LIVAPTGNNLEASSTRRKIVKYALLAVCALGVIGCSDMKMDDSQLGKNYTVPNAFDPANQTRSEAARDASCQSYPAACMADTRRVRVQP
jgi:hypothetical protein